MKTGVKSKSPAAPSRSLKACWETAAKIYNSYGHTEFGGADIAGTADLSANSGPAKSLISDLKQYGLIEKTSAGRFKISQELKDAHASGEDSQQFKAAMYEFVKRPPVFQKILVDIKGKLPEVGALSNTLRSTYSFNSGKAEKTATAISGSLDWAGVLDGKRNIIESRLNGSSAGGNAPATDDDDVDEAAEPEYADSAAKLLGLDIPLTDGRIARVKYPSDLSAEEAKKIGAVLAAICG